MGLGGGGYFGGFWAKKGVFGPKTVFLGRFEGQMASKGQGVGGPQWGPYGPNRALKGPQWDPKGSYRGLDRGREQALVHEVHSALRAR